MANKILDTGEFLERQFSGIPVLDVRTPAEFQSGHIPGAFNLPIFNNEERAIVGTIYKQASREKAILKGLELVGPRLGELAQEGIKIARDKTVLIHCWRGGMRSSSVAWLLGMMGVETFTLLKGYKNFRNYVLNTFDLPYKFNVLGGKTGSAKTLLLKELQKRGEQIIDLEGLASHRGSAFGGIGYEKRPTQEQFENELAMKLRSLDPRKTIWLEDESRHVGSTIIPGAIWEKMRSTRVYFLDLPAKARVNYLLDQYGFQEDMDLLKKAFFDIKKRLGDARYTEAVKALEVNDLASACQIALDYYDKAYEYGLSKRDSGTITRIQADNLNVEIMVDRLLSDRVIQEKICQI